MIVTETLAKFVAGTPANHKAALHVVRLSMLDWAAVTIGGQNEPVARIVRELVREEKGTKQAIAIGLERMVPARSAALVNGTVSHALDYDDTHFAYIGHPSVAVFPAAFAIADKINSNMQALQEASLIGLETATRVGIWLGRTHYRTGFHITSTAGTFGATAACARLLGLSPYQTRMALSLAASKASGIKVQFGTMGKPFHAGMAASAGVEACLLAEKGFVSGDNGLDGNQGFDKTHRSENNDFAFENMGLEWLFRDVSHKFHACCHGTHAMLEAIALLKNRHDIDLDEIENVEVTTHPQYLNVCNIQKPSTGLEAKFSYRLIAAMGLLGIDTSHPDSFTDKICRDADLKKLRDIIVVKTAEHLTDSQVQVTIQMSNNRTFQSDYDLLDLKDPTEREMKVRKKAKCLLGLEKADFIWEQLDSQIVQKSDQSLAACILL